MKFQKPQKSLIHKLFLEVLKRNIEKVYQLSDNGEAFVVRFVLISATERSV